jgi:hypothetical protein
MVDPHIPESKNRRVDSEGAHDTENSGKQTGCSRAYTTIAAGGTHLLLRRWQLCQVKRFHNVFTIRRLLAEEAVACGNQETASGAHQREDRGRVLRGIATTTGHGSALRVCNGCNCTEYDGHHNNLELHMFLAFRDETNLTGYRIGLSMKKAHALEHFDHAALTCFYSITTGFSYLRA